MKIKYSPVKCIVVFVPNKKFFGANVLQIPFFQHIRKIYPDAEIIIWSPEAISGMMIQLGLANKLCLYKNWKDYFRIMFFLWKAAPDIVFNLRPTSEGLNLLTGLSLAKLRIGFKSSSPLILLLNRRVPFNDFTYMARLYMDLIRPLKSEIYFYFDGIKDLDKHSEFEVERKKKNICFMPGGGEGEHKKWGIENFCMLGKLIQNAYPESYIYFVIGPQESDYKQVIEKEFSKDTYYILDAGSIPDIVKILKSCILTVANDCGPSHLAQMCEVNYIGIWGWKNQHPQSRIIKWTMARPNSVQIVAREREDIKRVEPREVINVIKGFLNN